MLRDDLGGWGGMRWVRQRLKKEVIQIYFWLIHIIVHQKPARHHKVIDIEKMNQDIKKENDYLNRQ